jgi:hypothetical protein
MDNTNNLGYVKLAMALVLSLLMAPSPAVAESEYLNQFSSDKYLGLGKNQSELWAQSDGESLSGSETDSAQPASEDYGGMSLKELSQQSANPVSKNAYIFTQFAATFNDGDLNTGDSHIAGSITFQPIIPIPLYGSGEDEWRIVTRPTINLFLGQPVPKGEVDSFDRETDLSDLLIPLPLALPERLSGRWLLALGPSFSIPTATEDRFGKNQWTAGVSGVFGYIADNWMLGMYPQTYFKIADQDRDDDDRGARFGNMFYWFFYNLTDAWQIGTNPTINWNDKAGSGNKWNVPVGLTISKITKWGNLPIRLEFGVDYSVVNEDDYGEVARIKFNLIPVVGRPIKKAIFGGK